MSKCYKVVTEFGDELYSLMIGNMPKEYLVRYYPNIPTTPLDGTYLFVCTDYKEATIFYNMHVDAQLWECEAELVDCKSCRPILPSIREFWLHFKSGIKLVTEYSIFFGDGGILQISHETGSTRFAKSVTLTQRLK